MHRHLGRSRQDIKINNILKSTLDPDNDLRHRKVDGGKDIECTYRGKNVSYDEYLDIHEDRGERVSKGKQPGSVGMFGGFGAGTLKKSYED